MQQRSGAAAGARATRRRLRLCKLKGDRAGYRHESCRSGEPNRVCEFDQNEVRKKDRLLCQEGAKNSPPVCGPHIKYAAAVGVKRMTFDTEEASFMQSQFSSFYPRLLLFKKSLKDANFNRNYRSCNLSDRCFQLHT